MRAKLPSGTLDKLWSDPAHWRAYSFYCCDQDPRIIVPKRKKWGGWTFNFAHPSAWVALCIAILFPLGLILYLEKSPDAFWLIPGLGIFTVLTVAICPYLSSTQRYEENPQD